MNTDFTDFFLFLSVFICVLFLPLLLSNKFNDTGNGPQVNGELAGLTCLPPKGWYTC